MNVINTSVLHNHYSYSIPVQRCVKPRVSHIVEKIPQIKKYILNKEIPYDLKNFGRLKVIGYKNVRYIPVHKKEVLYMRKRLALFVYII